MPCFLSLVHAEAVHTGIEPLFSHHLFHWGDGLKMCQSFQLLVAELLKTSPLPSLLLFMMNVIFQARVFTNCPSPYFLD